MSIQTFYSAWITAQMYSQLTDRGFKKVTDSILSGQLKQQKMNKRVSNNDSSAAWHTTFSKCLLASNQKNAVVWQNCSQCQCNDNNCIFIFLESLVCMKLFQIFITWYYVGSQAQEAVWQIVYCQYIYQISISTQYLQKISQ